MSTPPSLPHKLSYLEDLTVGQKFSSRTHQIDEAQIIEFAEKFDPQPFHIGGEAAAASIFGGLIASGWHTAAITMRLLLDALPLAIGTIGMGGEAEWPLPTRPHDILQVKGEILAIKPSRSRPDRGVVTIYMQTLNQNNQAVQLLKAKLLAFRRP